MEEDALSLRSLIKATGKTQTKVAEEIGVDRTYLSQMVNGKVNWVNSAYFPALVAALGLTFRQVEALRPDAVTQLARAAAETGIALAKGEQAKSRPFPLPSALAQAIELHSRRFPDLLDPAWQQYLAGFRWRHGEPDDPEAWLDLYRDLARAGIVPGGN